VISLKTFQPNIFQTAKNDEVKLKEKTCENLGEGKKKNVEGV